MAVGGVGFSLFQTPNNRALLSLTPLSRSGGANGLLGSARTLGQTIGAALVGVVFAMAGGHAGGAVLGLAAGIAVLAAGVSVARMR